jgi:hypothetical protein
MHTLQRASLLMVVVLLAMTACVIPNVAVIDPVAQATIMAATVDAAVHGTLAACAAACGAESTATTAPQISATPSATESQTLTPSATPPPTETPTATISPTTIVINSPTSSVPMISVSVPTNCRSGPGKVYALEGALLVGEVAQVLGRDPTSNYWYIPNPDSPGDYCWVWGEYATISGYIGAVPMFTPPPTPLPTMTPPPAPGFGVSYDGLLGCSGSWWAQMEIENTGALTFRSMEFSLIDQALDTEDIGESDGFVYRPNCSSSSSKETLVPGASLLISSPKLSNDPDGHKMRAHITLCSETGLDGQCVTVTHNFKP